MARVGLEEKIPVVELRVMAEPAFGRCGFCGEDIEVGEEYLYDNGRLMCEGCLDVEYPDDDES